MTIDSQKKLILRINEALAAKATGGSVLALAQEYTLRCGEAAARLDRCAAMLAKGSEYQALQLAESEPSVPEVLAILRFPGREFWTGYCREHQLPVPSAFEEEKLQGLEALYARGITTAHPLYADYRAANSLRDDAAALRIIRSIARLNPADTNAQEQQNRLEEKRIRESAAQLKAALQNGNEQQAARLTLELQALATPQRLSAVPGYEEGCAVQQKLARERAAEFVRETLQSLPQERPAGEWQSASASLARVEQTCMEHGLAIPPDLQALNGEMRDWVTAEETRAAEQYDFRRRLNEAIMQAAEIEGRLSGGGYGPAEARQRLSALEQAWEAVVRCGRPVAADQQQRVQSADRALRQEVERMRRRRRLTLVSLSGAAAALLALAGWAAYSWFNSSRHITRLAELQDAGKVADTASLLADLTSHPPGLAAWAGLDQSIKTATSWVEGERGKLAAAEKELHSLEESAGTSFASLTAADITAKMASIEKHLAELVAEMSQPLAPRLAILQNKVDARLTAMRTGGVQDAEKQIAGISALLLTVSLNSPTDALRKALAEATPLLEQLQMAAAGTPEQPAKLPEALGIKIKRLQQTTAEFQEQLTAFDKAEATLARATTLEEFSAALALFRDLKLAEAQPARSAAVDIPTPARVLAAALYDDPAQRDVLAKRDPKAALHPKLVLKEDLSILLQLREDEYLSDVYVLQLTSSGQARTLYSKGKPKQMDVEEGKPATAPKYTGTFYTPREGDNLANFLKGAIPDGYETLANTSLSTVSSFLQSLNLEAMTDASGEHYTGDLMRVFSLIAISSLTPASARYDIWLRLAIIAERDPEGWGLTRCPALVEDLRKARALLKPPQGSAQWMIPGEAKLAAPHAAFFKSIAGKSYTAEATSIAAAEARVVNAGAKFAGYTGPGGEIKLLPDLRSAAEYWLLDRVQNKCRLLRATPDGSEPVKDAPPFSPVFVIPLNRKEALAQFRTGRAVAAGPYYREAP